MARNSVTALLSREVCWCCSPEKYILSILSVYLGMLALSIWSFCNITLFGLLHHFKQGHSGEYNLLEITSSQSMLQPVLSIGCCKQIESFLALSCVCKRHGGICIIALCTLFCNICTVCTDVCWHFTLKAAVNPLTWLGWKRRRVVRVQLLLSTFAWRVSAGTLQCSSLQRPSNNCSKLPLGGSVSFSGQPSCSGSRPRLGWSCDYFIPRNSIVKFSLCACVCLYQAGALEVTSRFLFILQLNPAVTNPPGKAKKFTFAGISLPHETNDKKTACNLRIYFWKLVITLCKHHLAVSSQLSSRTTRNASLLVLRA